MHGCWCPGSWSRQVLYKLFFVFYDRRYKFTDGCGYNAVWYNLIFHATLQLLRHYRNQNSCSQNTLPWWASYDEVSFVRIFNKIDCVLTAPHCIIIPQNDSAYNRLSSRDWSVYAPSQWEMTLHCNVISHWLASGHIHKLIPEVAVHVTLTVIEPAVGPWCLAGWG